jgi:MobA-like NTP transferase protein
MTSDPAASDRSYGAGLAAPRRGSNGRCVEAVILAAGEGSRLGRSSKPLTEVAGLTLLERTVASVRAAGITRVVIVVGHAKEAVAEFVSRRGLEVELVTNDLNRERLLGRRRGAARWGALRADDVRPSR